MIKAFANGALCVLAVCWLGLSGCSTTSDSGKDSTGGDDNSSQGVDTQQGVDTGGSGGLTGGPWEITLAGSVTGTYTLTDVKCQETIMSVMGKELTTVQVQLWGDWVPNGMPVYPQVAMSMDGETTVFQPGEFQSGTMEARGHVGVILTPPDGDQFMSNYGGDNNNFAMTLIKYEKGKSFHAIAHFAGELKPFGSESSITVTPVDLEFTCPCFQSFGDQSLCY